MSDLKACAVCLSTDAKLYNMDCSSLREEYNLVSGFKTAECSKMPNYLCFECSAYVKRYVQFRAKCHRANFALEEILEMKDQITVSKLEAIDRQSLDIMPVLFFMDTNRTKYEEVVSQSTNTDQLAIYNGDQIPIIHYSTCANQFIEMSKASELQCIIQDCFVKLEHDDIDDTVKQELIASSSDLETYILKIEEDSDYFDNDPGDHYLKEDVSSVKVELERFDGTDSAKDSKESVYLDNEDNNHRDNLFGDNLPPVKAPPQEKRKVNVIKLETDASDSDEVYFRKVAISSAEAQAAVDVLRLNSQGAYRCNMCHMGYHTKEELIAHLDLHDQHVSGDFLCTLCNYYYKTNDLLLEHTTDNHMHKYECNKCNEVNFDCFSAKQHYIWAHQRDEKETSSYESGPKLPSSKVCREQSEVIQPSRQISKLLSDFPVYSPIKHEEQYALILERKKSRNYIEATYKCQFCYKGFKIDTSYNQHMRMHDPKYSGPYQCDICNLYFKNPSVLCQHMTLTHLFKYSCQLCKFVCFNKRRAHIHYSRHKNVAYLCQHCDKKFKTVSARHRHIQVKHNFPNICNMCSLSFVTEKGLYCHKRLAHGTEARDVMDQGNSLPSFKRWTREEEQYLMRLVEYYRKDEYIPWAKVASFMKNRTKNQIYNKYFRLIGVRKGRFLPEEDAVILTYLDTFGLNFKRMAQYLPGRNTTQIRVRYEVLAKTRISTIWTVQEDKRLLQLMANGVRNYSRVSAHFPGKNRVHIRGRYMTLLKWMKSHPNSSLDDAPRRAARCLSRALASENLNKATENLKKRIESEVESSKITRKSPLVDIEASIMAYLQTAGDEEDKRIESEVESSKITRKSPLVDIEVSIMAGDIHVCGSDVPIRNDEFLISPQSVNITNLQKLVIFLKGKLSEEHLKNSSFAKKCPDFLESQQEVQFTQVKSYSKKQKTVQVAMNSPDIWGNHSLGFLNYVLPPNHATITGCGNLTAYVEMMARKDARVKSCVNINRMIRNNHNLKDQMTLLMERFNALFLLPFLLSKEGPERVGKYVPTSNIVRKDVESLEKLKMGPDCSALSLVIPSGTLNLKDPSNESGSIDLEEPSAAQKAQTCVRKVPVGVDDLTVVINKQRRKNIEKMERKKFSLQKR